MIRNDSKNDQKLYQNFQHLTQNGQLLAFPLTVENVPGILDQYFWFWMVIYPKIHQSLKILTERSALLITSG